MEAIEVIDVGEAFSINGRSAQSNYSVDMPINTQPVEIVPSMDIGNRFLSEICCLEESSFK